MKIIIKGNPITKKNHSRIVKFGNKRAIVPSAQYKEYESNFISECNDQNLCDKQIDYPINVKCSYYMKTRRKVDLTNLLNGTDDALKEAGVILDDNCTIIVGHDGSRVYYDKENPRVEIEITKTTPTFVE